MRALYLLTAPRLPATHGAARTVLLTGVPPPAVVAMVIKYSACPVISECNVPLQFTVTRSIIQCQHALTAMAETFLLYGMSTDAVQLDSFACVGCVSSNACMTPSFVA